MPLSSLSIRQRKEVGRWEDASCEEHEAEETDW